VKTVELGAPKKMNKITINLIQEEILEEEKMVVKRAN